MQLLGQFQLKVTVKDSFKDSLNSNLRLINGQLVFLSVEIIEQLYIVLYKMISF